MFKEFDKIIGYEKEKQQLELLCDVVKNFDKYEKLGISFPGGLLLYGEPGVGKSLMANCFIEAAGLKAFVCKKNKPNGKFVDEIKKVFDMAMKQETAIVLLDDMDKYANEDYNRVDADEYVTIQSCIDECKNKKVFVIATVNDIYKLPTSLRRAGRFDKNILIESPTGEEAERIVEKYLNNLDNVGDLDAKKIANLLNGQSCAMLATVVNEAAMRAGFANKQKIDMKDIITSFLEMCYKSYIDFDKNTAETEITAYHEAGHMVLMEVLMPNKVNFATILTNKDNTLSRGVVSQTGGHYQINCYQKKVYNILISLGGKAATELKFNQVDAGCFSDLNRAFELMRTIVDDLCGFGFDSHTLSKSRGITADSRDVMITKKMDEFYKMTLKILNDNMQLLDRFAKELMEKHFLLRDDIDRILKEVDINKSRVEFIR